MNDLERAIDIALDAHEGDTDKAGETYIRHPLRLMTQMDTEQERIAAVLHDVVEDSDHELQEVGEEFGTEIRDAVDALSKPDDDEDYLEEYIPRVKRNEIAKAVKRADLQDNLDLTRLSEVDDDACERIQKYHRALQRLDKEPT